MTGLAVAQNSNSAATSPNTNSYQTSAQKNNYGQNSNPSQSEVRNVQQQLKSDGYYTGKIDGIDGANDPFGHP